MKKNKEVPIMMMDISTGEMSIEFRGYRLYPNWKFKAIGYQNNPKKIHGHLERINLFGLGKI